VSRSLAAGGHIPGLTGLEAQSAYDPYKYNGASYDLLWVSNIQSAGSPLGLREFLKAKGWINCGKASTCIKLASAVIVQGSSGAYGHVAIGIGANECDAHNNAHFHITDCASFYSVTEVWNPCSGCAEPPFNATVGAEQAEYVPHYERLAELAKQGLVFDLPV